MGEILLGNLDKEEFAKSEYLPPDNLRKRCKHVIFENDRVLRAVETIKRLPAAWKSHVRIPLRGYYEVSCRKLDLLVELARRFNGIIGSRMMGAGFGDALYLRNTA
ncbi:hypothetical protein KEJ21_00335 [Candidatus Bathyarchaeota archaeon]|nr:hypothetical protein [Candidatus Bathyarchaeota archaeon]MBS7630008.1 hypothetical protein [Candidatus Bathyarchaeota archaeon]